MTQKSLQIVLWTQQHLAAEFPPSDKYHNKTIIYYFKIHIILLWQLAWVFFHKLQWMGESSWTNNTLEGKKYKIFLRWNQLILHSIFQSSFQKCQFPVAGNHWPLCFISLFSKFGDYDLPYLMMRNKNSLSHKTNKTLLMSYPSALDWGKVTQFVFLHAHDTRTQEWLLAST